MSFKDMRRHVTDIPVDTGYWTRGRAWRLICGGLTLFWIGVAYFVCRYLGIT